MIENHQGKSEGTKHWYDDDLVWDGCKMFKDQHREFEGTCKDLGVKPNSVLNSLCQNFTRIYSGQKVAPGNEPNNKEGR